MYDDAPVADLKALESYLETRCVGALRSMCTFFDAKVAVLETCLSLPISVVHSGSLTQHHS